MSNKTKFGRFLSNNITLAVLSVLISLVLWFLVNAGSDVESNVPIKNIPISVELSQDAKDDGLIVFSKDKNASVEVSGNRLIVGSLSASDIQVVALDASTIVAPGEYELELSAKKTGVRTNYSIAQEISPSSIVVYVDRNKVKTFDIQDNVVYKVEKGYYNNSTVSDSKVQVSGPETIVNSISKVAVNGNLEGEINTTTTADFNLVFYDKEGNELKLDYCSLDISKVTVTMKPIPTKEVKLSVDVVNAPSKAPSFSISPDVITIAAEQSVLDEFKNDTVVLGVLDYSQLTNQSHKLAYDITLESGCKNLSGSTTATVNLDLSKYSSKKIRVDNFSTANLDRKEYDILFNSGAFDITVYGPKDVLKDLTSKNIISQVDFSNKIDDTTQESFSLELPFEFKFTQAYKECWVYGNYTVVVNVTKKQ